MSDREIIENLKLEVNALHAELKRDKKYDDVMSEDERVQRLADLKREFDELSVDDEAWVEVGSEEWTEEMDQAAKAEDDKPTKK
jgi:hypothetical protein